mgnify:CR=1 FL=1
MMWQNDRWSPSQTPDFTWDNAIRPLPEEKPAAATTAPEIDMLEPPIPQGETPQVSSIQAAMSNQLGGGTPWATGPPPASGGGAFMQPIPTQLSTAPAPQRPSGAVMRGRA